MRLNTREYLQEESRVLAAEAELNYYLDSVDALRADADRLEARIQRLAKKAETE
jgi:ubiquinone biosynthesis protein UbiJ